MKRIISIAISVSVLLSFFTAEAEKRDFSDVDETCFAYEEINYLSDKGIIRGIGDGIFAPENFVTRADFAVMADRAMELNGGENIQFSDVFLSDYYYYPVKRAAEAGIIKGVGNGEFKPKQNITKEEAASILVRSYESLYGVQDGETVNLADEDKISNWAKENVKKAVLLGFLVIDNDVVNPRKYMTRAETAYAISNYLMLLSVNDNWDIDRPSSFTQTTARGNIFLTSMSEKLITLNTEKKSVEYYIRDYWGNEKESGSIVITDKKHVFDVSDYTPGYYELYITARDREGLKEEIAKTSFCVFEDFDFKNLEYSPFGINTHITRGSSGWKPDLLYEASLAGIRHIRDSDEWHGVEKQKGVYTDTWASHRQIMQKYNIDNLWVSAFVNPFYDHSSTPYTDDGRLGYANYCKGIRDIWGEDMKYMEVYNEWWGPQFGDRGNGEANSLPETFVPLVKKTYEIVKPHHPDVVLMPTFSTNANRYQPNWNTKLLNLGILDYIDAIALHGYAGNDKTPGKTEPEGSIAATVSELREELDEKYPERDIDIFVTETGFNTSTNKYGISEKLGGWYVPRIFTSCMALGVDYIWWYDLIDDGNTDSEHEDRFGTLRAFGSEWGNYTPKPTYVAYGAFARLIAGQRFGENKTNGDIYWYTYEGEGETTNVIHARDNVRKNVTVYTSSPVEVTDLMGGKEVYTPIDGKLYFTISGESVYIKGDIEKIDEGAPIDFSVTEEVILEEEYAVNIENSDADITVLINGKEAENTFTPDVLRKMGDATVIAKLYNDGKVCGRITREVTPEERYKVSGVGDLESNDVGIDGFINAYIENYSPKTLHVTGGAWTLGNREGTFITDEEISGNSAKTIKIPVGRVEPGKKYDYTLRLQVDGITSGKRDLKDTISFNTVERFTPEIDGKVDEGLENLSFMNLDEGTVSSLIDGRKHTGPSDLGGKGWMSFDDEYLYWLVLVTDDDHNTQETGELMWRNDGLQFTLYCENSKVYDTSSKYFEFGITLREEGPEMWRWITIDGLPENKAEIPGAKFAASRNEGEKTTYYEIAIPWKTLSINPTIEKNIRSTLLINDNDSGQRKSFLEWGSGIGYGKDPEKFIKYIIAGGNTK